MNPKKFIEHILQEKITVQDKKGQREITKREALVEMIFSKAMAGDVKACKIVQDMFPDNYFTEEVIIEVVGMDFLEGL